MDYILRFVVLVDSGPYLPPATHRHHDLRYIYDILKDSIAPRILVICFELFITDKLLLRHYVCR